MTDRAEVAPGNEGNDTPQTDGTPRVAALEERVRRLEDVIAVLQDTRQMEDRVLESLSARVSQARGNGSRDPGGYIIDAGRKLLPVAMGVLNQGANTADAEARAEPPVTPPPQRSWLLFELYAEMRAMFRMYLDPRYRLGWQGRLIPLVLVALIATSWIWLPGAYFLKANVTELGATLYVKIVDLFLAYILFRTVHRETQRYRRTSPDLPPSLRL